MSNFFRDVFDALIGVGLGCALMWALELGIRADRPHPPAYHTEGAKQC